MQRRSLIWIGIRNLIAGLGALIFVAVALLQFIAQVFPKAVSGFVEVLANQLGWPILIGIVAVVALVWWIAEVFGRKGDAPPDRPFAPSGDLPQLTLLKGNLSDFRRSEGFVDEARREEMQKIVETLLGKTQRYRWWAQALRLLTFGLYGRRSEARLAVITGIGGIGKTSLAKRIGYDHRVRRQYPGGQHYFNFYGL